ncbi:low temperature requirement protein A [Amycolatopsis acidiphila]|uniref:Low temperature requirement protein A n=1 Tax=Amycolatopsis acidiphila TaxID=715473 RepID=A0A557ZSY9_9PSEU|nr:low temperature requirement protein A [Amycolatopsis acidiphila]TVT15139.1 low temperature requirement protein A [Amycolatopsis acidiphila]UIJ58484.1 low temperature requirement protein A [Amycolatopsis acidiphila]GHG77247.1 membrane protein [Amycolatopsis acidiphila]
MSDESRPRRRATRVWYRPMRARDQAEEHRASTPLELLFDLCFVVAVSTAGAQLHHSLGEHEIGHGIALYLVVFFAIWWGWVNFSWFASAFDTDDVPYRIATFLQIVGALVVAAGVPAAWHDDLTTVVVGYLLMRLAMVAQWLRAAGQDEAYRPTALRYALGITVVQIGWVLRLAVPDSWFFPTFLLLVMAELLVPVWAERTATTSWHARHISERYGLFTLIVLGESVLAASNALQEALGSGHSAGALISLAVAGLVIVFSMWWLYFDQPGHLRLAQFRQGYVWGYGHYVIFGSAAAVGVGLELVIDHDTHTGHLGGVASALALTVPVALYLLSVWLLHIGPRNECRPIAIGFPFAAVLVVAMSFTPLPVHLAALVMAALVATTVVATHGHPAAD